MAATSGLTALLLDLPSRGNFSSTTVGPVAPVAARVYICDQDTSPPDEQIIKTDTTNILIRALTSKKAKSDAKTKDKAKITMMDGSGGKRPAEKPQDEKTGPVKPNTGDEQIMKADTTSILVQSLISKNSKRDSKAKDKAKTTTDNSRGKRPAEKAEEETIASKKRNIGGASCSLFEQDIQSCTVEKLRSLLKKYNLPRTGKKDELIARLKQAESS